jgi:8-oxo-dGTP diphosphatase
MNPERYHLRAAVYLVLIRDAEVLLARRANTGWQDGKYSMIAGHLDGNETVTEAVVRESREEAGLELHKRDLRVVHTMHRKSKQGLEYIDFFVTTTSWVGEPKIMEPDKCDDLRWFKLAELPDNILLHVKRAIDSYLSGVPFSECGWDDDAE